MAHVLLRNVRQAIRTHFLESLESVVDPDRVAWENNDFEPPKPDPTNLTANPYWIRETCQVISEQSRDFTLIEMLGRTVFDVFYPVGKRTERAEDLCQAIIDAFESKSWVSNGGVVVGLDRATRDIGIKVDDAWWMASVGIYWRSYSIATPQMSKVN